MQASSAADTYGLFEGHKIQQADAEQAYTQSKLGGAPTYIFLPRDEWPEFGRVTRNPARALVSPLYGQPDSGGHWEQPCECHVLSKGFVERSPRRSCHCHPQRQAFLHSLR